MVDQITVDAYTKEHMDAIQDATIVGAHLSGNELILEKHDGTTIDVGNVKGATGSLALSGVATPAEQAELKTNLGLNGPLMSSADMQTDFEFPDGPIAGNKTQSGHILRTVGSVGTNQIANGVYAPTPASQQASIVYADVDEVIEMRARFVWMGDGTTHGSNVVMGAGYFNSHSIQNCLYARTNSSNGYDWYIFGTDNSSGTVEYPSVQGGTWQNGFSFNLDGVTEYEWGIRRVDKNTVLVMLPDGSNQLINDSTNGYIRNLWGQIAGLQLRMPQTTDNHVYFKKWSVKTAPRQFYSQPTPGAYFRCPGSLSDYLTSPNPGTALGDFEIVKFLSLDQVNAGIIQNLISCWDTSGELGRGFAFSVSASGRLALIVSSDGTAANTTNVTSSVLTAANGAMVGYGVSRTVVDGAVAFYYATDPQARFYPFSNTGYWTPWGTASTPAGAIFASKAPIHIGYPDTSGASFAGDVLYAAVRNGVGDAAVPWSGIDFSQAAPFSGILNTRGWTAAGNHWSWIIPESAVQNLSADIALLKAATPAFKSVDTTPYTTNNPDGGSTAQFTLKTSPTIASTDLAVGQVYKVRVLGSLTSVASGGAFPNWSVRPNGSAAPDEAQATGAPAVNQTNAGTLPFYMEADFYITAIGSSGSVEWTGRFSKYSAAGSETDAMISGRGSLDLSTGLFFDTRVTLPSAASGAGPNSVETHFFAVSRVL